MYRQFKCRDKEAGGILIGRILIENDNIIIDDVSEPMSTDIRKRARFKRKPKGHQEYFNEVWDVSLGRCFYLGEWHTHPEKVPHPSQIDTYEWLRIVDLNIEVSFLFFVILGTEDLRVWYCHEDDKQIIALERMSYE